MKVLGTISTVIVGLEIIGAVIAGVALYGNMRYDKGWDDQERLYKEHERNKETEKEIDDMLKGEES